jgi:hypothetical protein
LVDYAKEIELSRQSISPLQKLYKIWDDETKAKLEERWVSDWLEKKYWFIM